MARKKKFENAIRTEDELREFFEAQEDTFLKFEEIPAERRLSKRKDLNGFLLLDQILGGDNDIVCAAEHDEIYLEAELEQLAALATDEQLLDLIRSGVRFGEYDGLAMFV